MKLGARARSRLAGALVARAHWSAKSTGRIRRRLSRGSVLLLLLVLLVQDGAGLLPAAAAGPVVAPPVPTKVATSAVSITAPTNGSATSITRPMIAATSSLPNTATVQL